MKFYFLAFKKMKKKKKKKRKKKKERKILKIRITAIFFYQFLLNILFTDYMKVHYAGDKNLNRKDAKKYVEIKKK